MGIEFEFRKFASRFQHLPGYHILANSYLSISDTLNSLRAFGTLQPEGYFKTNYNYHGAEPVWIWIDEGTIHNRRKLTGDYERPILKCIWNQLDGETTFWEVGAASGYFSLLAAQKADTVVAVDKDDKALKQVENGAKRNGFENIYTLQGTVGDNLDLDRYDQPDLALIDIEGWEYEALKDSALIEGTTKLIIEIHEENGSGKYSHNDPSALKKILRENGFQLETIFRRSVSNYHILADKQG